MLPSTVNSMEAVLAKLTLGEMMYNFVLMENNGVRKGGNEGALNLPAM